MIDDTLYDAFGQRQVATLFTQLNQYRVVLEIKPEFQHGPHELSKVFLRSSLGGQVPLAAFTRYEQTTGPLAVSHQGQFPVDHRVVQPRPGVSLGDAVTEIENAKKELGNPAQRADRISGHRARLHHLPRQ